LAKSIRLKSNSLRGYLVQTIIAPLDELRSGHHFEHVTPEPSDQGNKVDIHWEYSDGHKFVQVKSSPNRFGEAQVRKWAAELEAEHSTEECELWLVGAPGLRRGWLLLAVFNSSFDLRAAAAIWKSTSENSALPITQPLVNANLVEWNSANERFRLHDLARQFCFDRLDQPQSDAAWIRYAMHYRIVLIYLNNFNFVERSGKWRRTIGETMLGSVWLH